jgi:hypothetical protein
VRGFQLHLIESGTSICNRNRIMTGVRFLFRVTLRRHDLAAEVWHIKEPERLPPVLSPEEVKRVLTMATARAFLNIAPPAADPQEQPDIATDTPPMLSCPCPRCGGRMIVIETFAPGCEPRWRPTPSRIDTS